MKWWEKCAERCGVRAKLRLRTALLTCLLVAAKMADAQTCAHNPAAAPTLNRLKTAMEQGRFISYTPTGTQLVNGKPTRTEPDTIRADLKVLRPRFDGLITYNATNGAEAIPAIAQELGWPRHRWWRCR